ncbi:MAG: flagellar motor switch protein FliN [Thermoguttaceae bacterium]|nr:flagellar motor switch protein FliN [Thermoguttaceae bacterium]
MADENELVNQDEIERLLQSAPKPAGASSESPAPSAPDTAGQDDISSLLSGGGKPKASAAQAVPDADRLLAQNEIDSLLRQAQGAAPAAPPPKPAATRDMPAPASAPDEGDVNPNDIELLLTQAERALASVAESASALPAGVTAFRLPEFSGAPPSSEHATLDLLRDVELDVKIELGRTNMYLEDVLRLRRGSVVPLDKLAGDPVDIFVNGRLVARGEVLVLNDNFCVRVAELIAGVNPG